MLGALRSGCPARRNKPDNIAARALAVQYHEDTQRGIHADQKESLLAWRGVIRVRQHDCIVI